jgi:hypothetical protein
MVKLSMLARVVILLSAPLGQGGDNSTAKKEPLEPLARFAGEWQVNGKWSNGEGLHAKSIYEWGLGKKILKAKTFVMNGNQEYQRYEGVMAWHPKKKCLYEISFSYDGSISEVVIEPKDRDTLLIGYTPFRAEQPQNVRQILKFTDKDHFIWTVELKQGDEWKQLIEATWVRKGAH